MSVLPVICHFPSVRHDTPCSAIPLPAHSSDLCIALMSGIIKKRIPRNRQGSLSRRAIQFIEKELAGDQGSASNASPAPTQTTPTHRPNDYSPKALADTYPTLGPTALQCYDRITAAIDGSSDDAVFSAFPRVPHLGALLAATHTAGYGEVYASLGTN